MDPELVIASSAADAGIGCWDLHSGAEHLRYRSCASPPHGLVCVGRCFLASSQLRPPSSSSSGSVLYWSWNKPQVEVKSFPAEPINPLASNSDGTYIVGGGASGDMYLWEVATGRLLKKWHAHYRAVTCLVFSDDQSLLISGAEDGSVRVWSLLMIFDDMRREQARHLYEYSFSEHTLRVTDIATGYGGCNAIIVSASEDRTCKVWSLSKGKLLRNIVFPSIIDAIALDPGEHVFYAGGRDGKIYIAALTAQGTSSNSYGMHIIGSLADHSKPVTCLAFDADGVLLVSGYEDGVVRVWDTKSHNIVRVFKHAKGPVNNILVARPPLCSNPRMLLNSQSSSIRRHGSSLPPPLEKYTNSTDEILEVKAYLSTEATSDTPLDASYISIQTMNNQIKELQQQGSSAAAGMEMDRLKLDYKKSSQMVQQWKKMYENLHEFCVNELLDGDQAGDCNGNST
ncbi:Protein ROOT INITIATION DEFECTIVE like [Actinidia chinensis var. chinensis]|uniref:Protein ROOT INITIATION DEFECTIVE like n=1 Tax=Actinidia chinensis var. chinensis TaxID=1590841 RepID=A0A2R6Q0Q8_ACTCC|nr:protein ROOT INITIATION DEFECTIVE 3-like [Actinidia eriantha]XP_057463365.1 protein ROOT INITIATION DEFECTIVE 3-like [Actinidia eriantha]XP_057463366.1 protein ROOT INITIATION DEFECTIVE 3-like [Actinidia eriantha]XP_057469844.1 protein ROOT INITIATION DEFECTIVE 3-like [Actinidia eriantha]XP_057469845.1 protein ROOT INITIATION DEFECTIVE 3-like [Actinidia eriantha]XP_057469846.1 protein ROOT INITIATION DEFECTIVE 3-like [Actinidia eriantha]XP_057469847.1 protein ROOT INITIATION DEFECTIVE 3-li